MKRHNPQLERRLSTALQASPEALKDVLASLSNADFRTAGYLLGERLLPQLDGEAYWAIFACIVPSSPKAYLGTFLKAAVAIQKKGQLLLSDARFAAFASQASAIDRRKTLETLLPHTLSVADCGQLVQLFAREDNALDIAAQLVATGTPAAYYELLQLLRRYDVADADVRTVCLALLRRADGRSFRMARLLQAYFGIEELPATFSFPIADYELSRLDGNYEQFRKLLENVKQ
ncbi:MAG: hypothetical protein J6N92_06515 [Alloprevotella sp.]|nr:hypothetical protein [Alloprevotella sp.]